MSENENDTVNVEDLIEGQEQPRFERRTDFANWNRYAAVNEEFVAIHMDDEAGRAAGLPSAEFGNNSPLPLHMPAPLNYISATAGEN